MKLFRAFLISSLLMLIGTGALVYGASLKYLATPLAIPDEGYVYHFRSGTGVSRMAHDLAREGFLKYPRWLSLLARVTEQTEGVQAGEYALKQGITPQELLTLVHSGKVVQYRVTFPEGINFREMRSAMVGRHGLRIVTSGMSNEEIMAQIGHPEEHPEGRFFPDTYAYTAGTRDLDILRAAYRRMTEILNAEWKERAPGLPYSKPYEGLIMASIVEKETGVGYERAQIAGVFVRRLKLGMRLQTDPTVVYGLGDRYKGNIRRKHLREPTPYNTYVIKALPPTPIAMPGRDAVHAAFHPDDGNTLYFVAKGDGSHYFSSTLAEHNRAVRKYQIERRAKNYRSAPPPQ